MNRTNSEDGLASKAAEGRRTPRRWRVGHSPSNSRQVLECAAPAALLPGRFLVPMHTEKSERGLSMNLDWVWSSAIGRYAHGPDRLKPELQTDTAGDFLISPSLPH